jgi:hypothetical protein
MNLVKIIKEEYNLLFENNQNKYPPIPDILYHGQPAKWDEKGRKTPAIVFDKFDQSKKRFLQKNNYGFYFTDSKYEAFQYAEGGHVYVCKVYIKNPFYYENEFSFLDKKDRFISSATFITKEDKEKLEKYGYDGVVLLTPVGKIGEVVALYPEQIKILDILK